MLSPSDDETTPSLHIISVSGDSDSPIYTTQPHFSSFPAADTRRPHHRLLGYRSDSTESTDMLGSEEISRLTHDMTLVARSSQLTFDFSTGISHDGTTISSSTVEDQGTPVLSRNNIYPVAPENFLRHVKRRKMLVSNPFCSLFFLTLFVLDLKKQRWSLWSRFWEISQSKPEYRDQSSTPVILMWTVFTSYDDIPEWSTCTHPEGGRYFHNAAKVLAHSL